MGFTHTWSPPLQGHQLYKDMHPYKVSLSHLVAQFRSEVTCHKKTCIRMPSGFAGVTGHLETTPLCDIHMIEKLCAFMCLPKALCDMLTICPCPFCFYSFCLAHWPRLKLLGTIPSATPCCPPPAPPLHCCRPLLPAPPPHVSSCPLPIGPNLFPHLQTVLLSLPCQQAVLGWHFF